MTEQEMIADGVAELTARVEELERRLHKTENVVKVVVDELIKFLETITQEDD